MKKKLALLLAGIMTLSLLTACGGSSAPAAEAPAAEAEAEAPAAEGGEEAAAPAEEAKAA